MNTPKTVEKGISEIVGCLSDPILVFPGGWGDTLPDWLKNAITLERLAMNMRVLKGELPTGTDAEACVHNKDKQVPDDIRVESLNDDQMKDLNRLKAWLYHKRTTVRLERERADRRQKKEEEAAQRKEAQPLLFEF